MIIMSMTIKKQIKALPIFTCINTEGTSCFQMINRRVKSANCSTFSKSGSVALVDSDPIEKMLRSGRGSRS